MWRYNKKLAIEHLEKHPEHLKFACKSLKDDRDVVLSAVKKYGFTLIYASSRLRDDKELVLVAVKENPWVLACVSERLMDDKDVVLEAVKKNGYVLQFASGRLRDDKSVVLEAVKGDYSIDGLEYLIEHEKYDKKYMDTIGLDIMLKSGGPLYYAAERFRDDKEVVLEAIKGIYGFWPERTLELVSKRLRADEDVVYAALKEHPQLANETIYNSEKDKEEYLLSRKISNKLYEKLHKGKNQFELY